MIDQSKDCLHSLATLAGLFTFNSISLREDCQKATMKETFKTKEKEMEIKQMMYKWLKILVKYIIRKTLMQFKLSAPSSPTPHEQHSLTKRNIPQNIIKR
ncbi:hypothetical protein MTR_7g066860 [Medicago truncatula]|uniref:Uncharacterized protein n=1 Tax=Medicago truncatula TaxID=3880 RepID=A0A072UBA9_MEDTR|nr:hypothetical protein MTR_7g066860 [Medicago truncatula]